VEATKELCAQLLHSLTPHRCDPLARTEFCEVRSPPWYLSFIAVFGSLGRDCSRLEDLWMKPHILQNLQVDLDPYSTRQSRKRSSIPRYILIGKRKNLDLLLHWMRQH
jgi:hypothetical protein